MSENHVHSGPFISIPSAQQEQTLQDATNPPSPSPKPCVDAKAPPTFQCTAMLPSFSLQESSVGREQYVHLFPRCKVGSLAPGRERSRHNGFCHRIIRTFPWESHAAWFLKINTADMSQKDKVIFQTFMFSGNSSLPLNFPRHWVTNSVSFIFHAPGQDTVKYLKMRR